MSEIKRHNLIMFEILLILYFHYGNCLHERIIGGYDCSDDIYPTVFIFQKF